MSALHLVCLIASFTSTARTDIGWNNEQEIRSDTHILLEWTAKFNQPCERGGFPALLAWYLEPTPLFAGASAAEGAT